MGRPKKNRKKAPEEKLKKGRTTLSRHGVTMHCSICGLPDQNKKGHANYILSQQQEQQENVWEEDGDDPSILEVCKGTLLFLLMFCLLLIFLVVCSTLLHSILYHSWIPCIKQIA
jgi:hypothetical protein